ncbi:MAG: hypothetical protein KKF67_03225, partial [Nanoarchaeota archaeon]|nr:hypothetical protein [Nanoarchaeota archaeon]
YSTATFPTDPTKGAPVKGGNYSGSILLNCTINSINSTGVLNTSQFGYSNVTFFYNASGGPTGDWSVTGAKNLTGAIWNDTALGGNDTMFNATADISLLTDASGNPGLGYNISCYADNGTSQEWGSVANVTIDNTPPAVTWTTTNISNNGNYSNNTAVVINVSVSDATIGMNGGYVYFNISNASNGLAPTGNFTKANLTAGGGGYYNATIVMSAYPDGVYKITVIANDSLWLQNASLVPKVNLNNTESINITIDRTAPSSVTIANTTSTTTTSVVATITAVDATSGINNCVADSSSGVAITGTGSGTQTMTHTSLTCGTKYSYIITCYDQVGNLKASSSTSLSTSPCSVSDSGSGGGGTTISTWTQTFVITDDQFEQGYSKSMGLNERAKISVGGEIHYVGVKEVTATTATIEISSNPVTVKLDIGEDAKIDVDDDGYYDIYVKLNSITASKADVTISYLNELKAEGEGAVSTSGEVTTGAGEEPGAEVGAGWNWKWIIIIAIIVIALVIWFASRKK